MVRPSFSRSVRRLFPAGSTLEPLRRIGESYQTREWCVRKLSKKLRSENLVTNSEQLTSCVNTGISGDSGTMQGEFPVPSGVADFTVVFGFRNKPHASHGRSRECGTGISCKSNGLDYVSFRFVRPRQGGRMTWRLSES